MSLACRNIRGFISKNDLVEVKDFCVSYKLIMLKLWYYVKYNPKILLVILVLFNVGSTLFDYITAQYFCVLRLAILEML